MAIPDSKKIYPRKGDDTIVYLKNVITDPNIEIGDFTFYNDFVNDPRDFEKNNVLYHYPINRDKLKIGKFCSIACGTKFLFNSANHTLRSLSTYPFPIFYDEWEHGIWADKAWDNKGDIVIGNDVWIGFEAVILAGDNRLRIDHWRAGGCYQRCSALHNRRRCSCKTYTQAFFR